MLDTVSPFLTVYWTPETGKITNVFPACNTDRLVNPLAQSTVFTDTLNILAMPVTVSPSRTTYELMTELDWSVSEALLVAAMSGMSVLSAIGAIFTGLFG